jgi:hypothetical protein
MTDPDAPTRSNGGPSDGGPSDGEGWVSGDRWSPRRVPGVHDVPEATYVDDAPRRLERRSMIIAGAIVLGSLAIGAGFVVAAGSKSGGGGDAEVSAAATLTSTSTRPSSTTTTLPVTGGSGSTGGNGEASNPATGTTPTTPGSTAGSTVGSSDPSFDAAALGAAAAPPATPPATANPAFDPYQGVGVPLGVSASLGPCGWNDGQLYASGNIASHDAGVRSWTLTVVWLQNSRELARTSTAIPLAPGEVKDWSLSLGSGIPPDIACAVEVA